jgi:hypothetical protein
MAGRAASGSSLEASSSRSTLWMPLATTIPNPERKQTDNGTLSPVDFEIRQQKLKKAGV